MTAPGQKPPRTPFDPADLLWLLLGVVVIGSFVYAFGR